MAFTTQRVAAIGQRDCHFCPSLPVRTAIPRLSIIRRFTEDERQPGLQQDQLQAPRKITDTKLTREQLEEVYSKEPGNISPRMAEMRADLGSAATDLSQFQSFDGPIPETVNGRLAMLGVVSGLIEEWVTGRGLLEQTVSHPLRVLAIGLLIAFASYAPVVKGYTRKEPFANIIGGLPWFPKVENWNGRLAMLGFTGMILTEAITGVNTLQAWGLQPLHFGMPIL